jgi:CheY-like chemotaxis protein
MDGHEAGDALDVDLQALWAAARPTVEHRFAVIERGVAAWRTGGSDDAPRRAALSEAHKLLGSLGLFGFERATALARELNRLLRDGQDGDEAAEAAGLVAALRRELDGESSAPEQSIPAERPAAGPARVLLADDDDTIARVIQVALRLDGLEVLRARDGGEAVRLAREQAVDLVLLDLEMPLMDGFEVCRTLRTDPRLADVPIVMLSAQSDPRQVEAGYAEGATEYLAKPFNVAELRERVRALLHLVRRDHQVGRRHVGG